MDVNRASRDQWLQLPGCSQDTADLLVRLQQGGVQFACADDLFRLLELPSDLARLWIPILDLPMARRCSTAAPGRSLDLNNAGAEQLALLGWPEQRLANLLRERRRSAFQNLADLQERLCLGQQRGSLDRPGEFRQPPCRPQPATALMQGDLFSTGALAFSKGPDLPLQREQLLAWQQRLHAHQAPLLGGEQRRCPGGSVRFHPHGCRRSPRSASADSPRDEFWRWPEASHRGAAIYLVMDRPAQLEQPLLLYVGETLAAERRWKGDHDRKAYLAAYGEALQRCDLSAQLSIRFSCDVPLGHQRQRALEQQLIQHGGHPSTRNPPTLGHPLHRRARPRSARRWRCCCWPCRALRLILTKLQRSLLRHGFTIEVRQPPGRAYGRFIPTERRLEISPWFAISASPAPCCSERCMPPRAVPTERSR